MPASQFDLTTLSVCKTWVGSTSTSTDDTQLQLLLTAVSRQIVKEVGYSPFVTTSIEFRDGNGNDRIFLKNRPVIRVNSVVVRGGVGMESGLSFGLQPINIPLSNGLSYGFMYDDSNVTLIGCRFPRGKSNVTLNYVYGQTDTIFERVVLSSTSYTVFNSGLYVTDLGVTYDAGGALVKVASSPARGQYTVTQGVIRTPNITGAGIYGFNAADNGAGIYINYEFGYIPEDWQQTAAEAVGLLYSNKKHIGQTNATLGGQHTQFLNAPLPPETKDRISLLRKKVPVV